MNTFRRFSTRAQSARTCNARNQGDNITVRVFSDAEEGLSILVREKNAREIPIKRNSTSAFRSNY